MNFELNLANIHSNNFSGILHYNKYIRFLVSGCRLVRLLNRGSGCVQCRLLVLFGGLNLNTNVATIALAKEHL